MVTKVSLNQEQTQLVSDTNQQQAQAIINAAQAGWRNIWQPVRVFCGIRRHEQ